MLMDGERLIAISASSDAEERKLWLDYIARLHDRRSRSNGSSGATSWALLGVLVAIFYKAVPQLPTFLADPNNLKNTLVSFGLEVDIAFLFSVTYFHVLAFYQVGIGATSPPERGRRLLWILNATTLLFQLVLTLSHLIPALGSLAQPTRVTWLLLGMGVFWASNFYLLMKRDIIRLRHARKYKIPVPWFFGSEVNTNWEVLIFSATSLVLGITSFAGLLWYLTYLKRSGADWLAPLAGSCYAIALVGILTALAFKGFMRVDASSYDSLERSILLESLSPFEIRTRFVTQLLGSNASEWLTEQTTILNAADTAMHEVQDTIRASLESIEGSERKTATEFKEDVTGSLTRLGEAVQQHIIAMQRHKFLITEFGKSLHGESETASMNVAVSDWKAQLAQMKTTTQTTHELTTRLIECSRSVS